MRKPFAIASFVIAIILALVIGANPTRRSDEGLQAWLQAKTPLGSKRSDVRAVLAKHGWQNDGYQRTQPPPASKPFLGGTIGGYQGLPWYTSVQAFWEFDRNDRLIAIRIRRTVDAP